MKSQAHYDNGFADIYAEWVSSVAGVTDANLKYYVARYLESPGLTLELGVGDGRIALEAAQQGKAMIGVDNSQAMLDLCAAQAASRGLNELLELQLADFRDFTLPHPASLIAIPFHSIGHMLTEADKLACMAHIFANLEPGGHFLFDHFVPDLDYARANHRRPVLRSQKVDPETGCSTSLWSVPTYDLEACIISLRAIHEEHDAEGNLSRRRVSTIPLSTIQPKDSRRLLQKSGFEVEACFGDFQESPLVESSGAQVWVARKPTS